MSKTNDRKADSIIDTLTKVINQHAAEMCKALGIKITNIYLSQGNALLDEVAHDYISYRWEEGMSAAEFGVKINRDQNCKVLLLGDVVSILKTVETTPKYTHKQIAKVRKGDWIVFGIDGLMKGTHSDEQHKKLYEIVADWR